MNRFVDRLGVALLATIVTFALSGCNDKPSEEYNIFFTDGSTVPFNSAGQFLLINTSESWNIDLSFPQDSESNWCTLKQDSGNGYDKVWIDYAVNQTNAARKALLTITMPSSKVELTLVQESLDNQGDSGEAAEWLELPDFTPSSTQYFVTHYTTINYRTLRNYSVLYDSQYLIPLWVAYPMHQVYTGNVERGNNWAFDPVIPRSVQADLTSAMGNGYDRGHMIPSADRLATIEANDQTFYGTNMTPQLNSLNAKLWANLEGQVRGWKGGGNDTLYVVTGAVLQSVGGNETIRYATNRNDSKRIAIPNYYYKVLLKRTMANNAASYKGIGFWIEHKAADGYVTAAEAKTIDWIEQKTGIDFFSRLDAATQTSVEQTINPALWGL